LQKKNEIKSCSRKNFFEARKKIFLRQEKNVLLVQQENIFLVSEIISVGDGNLFYFIFRRKNKKIKKQQKKT